MVQREEVNPLQMEKEHQVLDELIIGQLEHQAKRPECIEGAIKGSSCSDVYAAVSGRKEE